MITDHTAVKRTNAEIFDEMRNLQGVGGTEAQLAANAVADAAQSAIDSATNVKQSPWERVPAGVRQSYEQVLKTLLDRSPGVRYNDLYIYLYICSVIHIYSAIYLVVNVCKSSSASN